MEHETVVAEASSRRKRGASPSFDEENEVRRKRLKESVLTTDRKPPSAKVVADLAPAPAQNESDTTARALVDELKTELTCVCCAALCYNPVVVSPCNHFFCGSCCMRWILDGSGTTCPICRVPATTATYSAPLQKIIDVVSRHEPECVRTEREKKEADALYRPGMPVRWPSPRLPSPEPNTHSGALYARPCPHCVPGNQYGWHCPAPIPNPNEEPDRRLSLDDGPPPGHGFCGTCDQIHAVGAPSTTKCDFCASTFCGIGIPGRCVAPAILNAQPAGLVEVSDLVQLPELYEAFKQNHFETELMLEYLNAHNLNPVSIYHATMEQAVTQPDGWRNLVIGMGAPREILQKMEEDPVVPHRVCRECAADLTIANLKPWWIRERRKGLLSAEIRSRPDCPHGQDCVDQVMNSHAKQFNHILEEPVEAPPAPGPEAEAATPKDELVSALD